MAQNITLLGANYADVPSILLPKTDGGQASFVDISDTDATAADVKSGKKIYLNDGTPVTGTADLWNPYGVDAELIRTYDMGTTKLKDTLFNGWTPSTTAKTIKATSTLGTITSPALDTYEYMIKSVFESNTAYAEGTTLAAAVVRQIYVITQYIHRKPGSLPYMESSDDNYNYCTTLYSAPWMEYYSTAPSHTMAWTGSYGIYPAATAATFSATNTVNATITIKAPTYNAKCYKSYFKEAMASAVDQDASTIKCKVYVYRIKKDKSPLKALFNEIIDYYHTPAEAV